MVGEVIIRPPSEARSFLLPVTSGCSNNRCIFCGAYRDIRFRVRPLEEIKQDIDEVAGHYGSGVRRVFLENGDALIAPQPRLVAVLEYLHQRFPHLERVATYASPQSALTKSPEQLQALHRLGLQMAYLGVETGDEALLQKVGKGVTYDQMVTAGRKLREAGIILSAMVILGLGGVAGSRQHALGTARILSDIDPEFTGALTLMLVPGTPLYQEMEAGRFTPVSPFQALEELRLIIQHARFSRCFFTANHASNYLPIRARLPEQREAVLRTIEEVLAQQDISRLRPEITRAL
ncbi:MAG: radical SAM protein [Chloroflexota bacterium]